MIKFDSVSKTYKNGNKALDKVDLHVNDGDFVFVIGESGAGKTTLFKVLYLEESPDEGQIFFNDDEITRLKRSQFAMVRRNFGVVFQDFRLMPSASVFENTALVLDVLNTPEDEIEERVSAALKLVGLSGKELSFPWQLSGGERQRVALARALVGSPSVILADEPTAEVDPVLTWSIIEILEKVNKTGTTIMVATHDSEVVNSLKRRVIKLDHGRVVRDEKKGSYV
jgi:cell division transport system ATP-binding protein